MSGHSKWSTIKRAKGAADAKRSSLFGKLAKKISIAVWEGNSGDPSHNSRLRTEIDRAKEAGLPNDNIDRAIKNALGQKDSQIKEVVFEAYGPYGVALLIEGATNNNNRTVQEIKHILNKAGGSLGAQGSTAWQFKEIGQIIIETTGDNKSEIELLAIDCGAEDIIEIDNGLIIKISSQDLNKLKDALHNHANQIIESTITKISDQEIELTEEQTKKIENIISSLEENDDIVNVYSNAKI